MFGRRVDRLAPALRADPGGGAGLAFRSTVWWTRLHNGAVVPKRLGFAYALVAALLAVSSAGATQADLTSGATARAYGIRVVVPGQPGAATQTVSAPPDAVELSGTFVFGDTGAVTAESANATVSAAAGETAVAVASDEVHSL